MDNFTFWNPTKIIFGKGTISQLTNLTHDYKKILFLYGNGSIKKNNVYSQIKSALNNTHVIEFSGIEPNPDCEHLKKAIAICKQENIDFLLAAGGGSVIDGAKFVAAGACFEGDAWEILSNKAPIHSAIPLGAVLTLSATGTEMNPYSVISHKNKAQKLAFGSPLLFPKFSILDPETTYSLPQQQIINGIIDPFVHVVEEYLTTENNTPLQDKQACAILKTLTEEGPKTLANPNDYNSRANIMWCATQALNGTVGAGTKSDWSTHSIGHQLTALFGLDHAQTLAIILPAILKHQFKNKAAKLAQCGHLVWGLDNALVDETAQNTIICIEKFFQSLGAKTLLSDYGIKKENFSEIAKKVMASTNNQKLGEHQNIGFSEICDVLQIAG